MTEEKNVEETLGTVLESLAHVFEQESNKKQAVWLKAVKEEYGHLDLANPEQFGLIMALDIDAKVRLLAEIATQDIHHLDRKTKHVYDFLYTQYEFVKAHLEGIIKEKEGWSCNVDKTRWLIEEYRKHLLDGTTPDLGSGERQYWHPRVGYAYPRIWFDFIHSIYELYYGKAEEYIRIRQLLLDLYPEETTDEA